MLFVTILFKVGVYQCSRMYIQIVNYGCESFTWQMCDFLYSNMKYESAQCQYFLPIAKSCNAQSQNDVQIRFILFPGKFFPLCSLPEIMISACTEYIKNKYGRG